MQSTVLIEYVVVRSRRCPMICKVCVLDPHAHVPRLWKGAACLFQVPRSTSTHVACLHNSAFEGAQKKHVPKFSDET